MAGHRSLIVALVTASLFVGSRAVASAQMPPYTAYGMGLTSSDVVTASIDGVDCGSARVSAAGNWKISIWAEAPCHPRDGATVHFSVNGKEHGATVRWSGGGAPINPRVGVALGAASAETTPKPTSTARPKATATPTKTPTPTPLPRAVTTPAKTPTPGRLVVSTPRKRPVFR